MNPHKILVVDDEASVRYSLSKTLTSESVAVESCETARAAIERVRDSTIGFAPLNRFLADRVIARTRVGAEIARRRESWPAAMLAIERILVRVSEMVCELPQVLEMDINPIILDGSGAVAVDARIIVSKSR